MLRTHHIATFMLVALSAALMNSCCPEDPFVPTSNIDSTRKSGAFLRVMHAADDGPSVRVMVDSSAFFSAPIYYLGFPLGVNDGKYYPVDSNASTIRFLDSASGAMLASSSVKFQKGNYYSAYFYGERGDYRVLITDDDPKNEPSASQCRYRFVQLSPGSPPVTVRQDSANSTPVVTNLAFGMASPYITSKAYPLPNGTGLYVTDGSNKTLLGLPPPYIFLPGASVVTIVLTARSQPEQDQSFLTLSPLNDNTLTSGLYGSPPLFNLVFSVMRLVNICPTGNTHLDLAFRDEGAQFAPNDYFRRNLPGMEVATDVPHLQDAAQPYHFVMSKLLKDSYPFRVEYHTTPFWNIAVRQPVLVKEQAFTLKNSRRYMVVAYGPFDSTQARAAMVQEYTFGPAVGRSYVRFFNGEFGSYKDQKLRLRIGSTQTDAIAYTDALPLTANYVDAPAGSATLEVVDASNNVIASKSGVTLVSKKTYYAFLSRGSDGSGLRLDVLSSDIVLK